MDSNREEGQGQLRGRDGVIPGVRLIGWAKEQDSPLLATLTASGHVEYRVVGSFSMGQPAEA